jgi:predicted ATPase
MGRLAVALQEAKTRRVARLVTVVGDAGVGKSRLIKEFATRAGEAARVLRGRCLPYGDGITFWPFAEVVREAATIAADDTPDVAVAKLASLLRGSLTRNAFWFMSATPRLARGRRTPSARP